MPKCFSRFIVGSVSVIWFVTLALTSCSPSGSEQASDKGQSASAKEPLCKHEVAEKFCPLCHPEIRNDPNVLLCKEHGNIPEEICTACHPELKKKYKTCEHELPPAFCATCQIAKGATPEAQK